MSLIRTYTLALVAIVVSSITWFAGTTHVEDVTTQDQGNAGDSSLASAASMCTNEKLDDVTFVSCGGFF